MRERQLVAAVRPLPPAQAFAVVLDSGRDAAEARHFWALGMALAWHQSDS
jgi:hypothetical protein